MPAQSYLLKGHESCFYFFNPFSVEIFGQVIQNIYDSLEESPRECALILYYPDADYIYYIENYTGLKLHKIVKVAGNQFDPRECFYIYYF